MTATTTRPAQPVLKRTPPPTYRWVPLLLVALLAAGGVWGAVMYYLAAH